MLADGEWKQLSNIEIHGLMCMASNTEDTATVSGEFSAVKELFEKIKREFFPYDNKFNTLSAGMSDDYPIAIEHGSTHIRIGSSIFND